MAGTKACYKMIYVDELFFWPGKGEWCHLWADTTDELHEFAEKIGLKRNWFQDKKRFPHYDLRESKRKIALKNGAIQTRLRNYLQSHSLNFVLKISKTSAV
jgi:hypothetical protein